MSGNHHGCLSSAERLGQLIYESNGQVIGRLVQEQHVRAARERKGEIESALLAHRQLADPLAHLICAQEPQ